MERYLSLKQVGEVFGVRPPTVGKWIRQGRLQAARLAGNGRKTYRVTERQIEDFVDRHVMKIAD